MTDQNASNRQSDLSWSFSYTPDSESFYGSETYATLGYLSDYLIDLPDTCGKGTLGQINTGLLNFFTALKGIEKYGETYLIGGINKIQNITNLISQTADIIGSILKILVQRARNWLMKQIRDLIEIAIEYILPTIAKVFKDLIIDDVVKQILCAFDKIIDGLVDLVVDFLYAFVQEIVNPVFCAVEGFTNALINNLAATIDEQIQPILDNINDVLGGAVQIAGSIFEAIDYILGFESFLCQQPNCPEVKSFKQGPWGGPTDSQIDDFNNFASVSGDSIVQDADDALADFFGEDSNTYAGPLNCNTDPYACGLPNVEIFGGGGSGAIGSAIVNSVGNVVGVDLVYGGSNYTSPPFVTFTDSCNNGEYASAYSVINDNGEVEKIVIVDPGGGYLSKPDGTDEFGNPIGGGGDTGETGGTGGGGGGTPETPTEPPVEVREYVGCLSEFQIISTGIGYTIEDSVTINPSLPNLEASIKLTPSGQIISIDVTNIPCDLNVIPEVTINSNTGSGAKIRPILNFTRVNNVETFDSQTARNFKSENLVRVIDCVKR